MAKKSPDDPTERPVAPSRAQAAPPSTGPNRESPSSRWTFLTNHAHVLILLHANPEMVLREVASEVGIT
jgi:hypothetical protein